MEQRGGRERGSKRGREGEREVPGLVERHGVMHEEDAQKFKFCLHLLRSCARPEGCVVGGDEEGDLRGVEEEEEVSEEYGESLVQIYADPQAGGVAGEGGREGEREGIEYVHKPERWGGREGQREGGRERERRGRVNKTNTYTHTLPFLPLYTLGCQGRHQILKGPQGVIVQENYGAKDGREGGREGGRGGGFAYI